jgi:transcriptional regulator with XRE-family HTH domain
VGVSRQAISKWETDQSLPDLDKIVLLCGAFSVSADDLLGHEPKDSNNTVQMEYCIRANLVRRLFTIGWITAPAGVVLLIIELLSLYYIKRMEIASAILRGSGYRPDTWYYAVQFPMSAIFIITGIVILIGIGISLYSLHRQKK